MIAIDESVKPSDLAAPIERMWQLSGDKILSIESTCGLETGTPVFTVQGRYTAQGWTEWTQGFQFGAAILQFDATDENQFLKIGRNNTIQRMASHVTHVGVHDHGFHNVSTYGNLRRLMLEGRFPHNPYELDLYELALKASGAVQASRWNRTADGDGYIASFNGPHSLFSDTIRTLRVLALAHKLGHQLMGENDQAISLLDRLVQHLRTTARYNVYYGEGRDIYDVRGRVAHESIFNPTDGRYRCPSTQQGFSPFSTWTRGLAWIMLGYAEELEFLQTLEKSELEPIGGYDAIEAIMRKAALAACDFYIDQTPVDGVPYWDTAAPGLQELGDYLTAPADPFNPFEPVDSSAAAIAAQGLLRLGRYLDSRGQTHFSATTSRTECANTRRKMSQTTTCERSPGSQYWQAGLTVLRTLFDEPYLSVETNHQGLLLHAVYHRPRNWDHVPENSTVPHGESCMWGDYHLREVGLYLQRIIRNEPYYTFFGPDS